MRRLTPLAAFAASGALVACASAGSPPGGPPDTLPPQVVAFSPDSGAVNFTGRAVVIRFDETINDRGTGPAALEALVVISPRDGEPRVSWDRDRIAVRPRDGWRANTAYSVTVAPGIGDLRGNRSRESRTITFSTGPSIPAGAVTGRVFDWGAQQVARTAWIEALRTADSAVFVTSADSNGQFGIAGLGPGDYVVRGYVDQNANRVLDRTETWDSVRVVVGTVATAPVELLLAARDTFPARILNLAASDSATLRVEFDKPLDPAQPLSVDQIRVVRADSTPLRVTGFVTLQQHEADRAAARARADTGRAADSSARGTPPRDTVARADTVRPPARPSRPAPPTTLVATLAEPLAPRTTYRVTVTGIRTLLGRTSTATRLLTIPARDTTPASPAAPSPARDSARTTPARPR